MERKGREEKYMTKIIKIKNKIIAKQSERTSKSSIPERLTEHKIATLQPEKASRCQF